MQQVLAVRLVHAPTTMLLVQLNPVKNHADAAKAVLTNAIITTVIASILSMGDELVDIR